MTEYVRPRSRLLIGGLGLGFVVMMLAAILVARPHTSVDANGYGIDHGFRPSMLVMFGGQALLLFGLPLALILARPQRLRVYDDRIELRRAIGTQRLAMADLLKIGWIRRSGQPGAGLGGLVGALAAQSDVRKYIFIGARSRVAIDGALVDEMRRDFDALYQRAIRAAADNAVRSIAAGGTYTFGTSSLNATEVVGVDGKRRQVRVPLARITAVTGRDVYAGGADAVCTLADDPVLLAALAHQGIQVA